MKRLVDRQRFQENISLSSVRKVSRKQKIVNTVVLPLFLLTLCIKGLIIESLLSLIHRLQGAKCVVINCQPFCAGIAWGQVIHYTLGKHLRWSLCTLYIHACQVRVTVGDSGLCCTCVTSFGH